MTDVSKSMIAQLDQLLDKERKVLLSGRMSEMSKLLKEKEDLVKMMSDPEVSGETDVARLRDKVLRNQELLDSALQGIRAVAERVSALRQARMSLETYDKSGARTSIETRKVTSVEKRA